MYSSGGQWAPDDEDTLRRMWAEGFSGAEIGRIVGRSRNSVIGKAHRLGLSMRTGHAKRKAAKVNRPKEKRGLRIASTKPLIVYSTPRPIKLEVPPMEKPVSLKIQLMDLKVGRVECRWIDGEPTSGFCGHKVPPEVVERGLSYCMYHFAIAYPPRAQQTVPSAGSSGSKSLPIILGRKAA